MGWEPMKKLRLVTVWGEAPKADDLIVSQKKQSSLNVNMGADLLSSLRLSNDEAVARAVSR